MVVRSDLTGWGHVAAQVRGSRVSIRAICIGSEPIFGCERILTVACCVECGRLLNSSRQAGAGAGRDAAPGGSGPHRLSPPFSRGG